MPRGKNKWSAAVTEGSNALDLEPAVFTLDDPKRIAASLARSALASSRRKGTPLESAMSMLNLYVNRAGKNLAPKRRAVLERTKEELRKYFRRGKGGK